MNQCTGLFPTHCMLSNCSLFLYSWYINLLYKIRLHFSPWRQLSSSICKNLQTLIHFILVLALYTFHASSILAWVQGYTNTCTWSRSKHVVLINQRNSTCHIFSLMLMTSLQCMGKITCESCYTLNKCILYRLVVIIFCVTWYWLCE